MLPYALSPHSCNAVPSCAPSPCTNGALPYTHAPALLSPQVSAFIQKKLRRINSSGEVHASGLSKSEPICLD